MARLAAKSRGAHNSYNDRESTTTRNSRPARKKLEIAEHVIQDQSNDEELQEMGNSKCDKSTCAFARTGNVGLGLPQPNGGREEPAQRKQRALKSISGNGRLPQDMTLNSTNKKSQDVRKTNVSDQPAVRQTPSRRAKRETAHMLYKPTSPLLEVGNESPSGTPTEAESNGGSSSDFDEDCSGSEDEDSLALIDFWSQRYPRPSPRKPKAETIPNSTSVSIQESTVANATKSAVKETNFEDVVLQPPRPLQMDVAGLERTATFDLPKTPPRTPSRSPHKSRLNSPSKSQKKIPMQPFRPSIDAFWNAAAVNEWNDQYSPRKEALTSPRKNKFRDFRDRSDDWTSDEDKLEKPALKSPKKESPSKPSAKREFDKGKHALAKDFLQELDQRLTEGKISELTASSGGVQIVWSKSLNKTAGRASWKRVTVQKAGDVLTGPVKQNIASVELAEKVIDDEEKLVNTLAHEFCHLTTFMISNVRDQPHGAEFKAWGRKATKLFADRGVHVTTKHSYEIDYKYIWECSSCGLEYKRHSKSINPAKQGCGSCKSKLLQVKPVVRLTELSGYQLFVKENYGRVKGETAQGGHAVVMEKLGRLYREKKEAAGILDSPKKKDLVEDVVEALGVICLDD